MNINYKALALGFGSVLLITSCSSDEIEQVNQGSEITFNTAVSRAANITTETLSMFKVWGQAVDYTGNMLINGQVAERSEGQNYFKIDDPVYWPSDIAKIDFWAVSPTNVTIIMEQQTKEIKDFTPAIVPEKQQDLIVAYEQALRSQGTSVRLTFNHALSQIVVKAKRGTISVGDTGEKDETKEVFIKGAWIVNVLSTGTLAFNKESGQEKHYMEWVPSGIKTSYGALFPKVINLSGHNDHDVLEYNKGLLQSNNLMLVPQQLDKWNLDDNDDKIVNRAKGAYILLLCRVTTTHNGSTHVDGSNTGGVQIGDGSHKHQLFPYTGNFSEQEYGYTCIPINTLWEPGKKYIYTLEFCGPTSGAGVYPNPVDLTSFPDSSDGGYKYIKTIPSVEPKKTVGDPVLDQPIRFTVDVEDWEDGWVNGEGQDTGGGNMGM